MRRLAPILAAALLVAVVAFGRDPYPFKDGFPTPVGEELRPHDELVQQSTHQQRLRVWNPERHAAMTRGPVGGTLGVR